MDIFLSCFCLWQISQFQTGLCVVVGPGFVSTSTVFMRSSARHPAGPHGRLAQKTVNRSPKDVEMHQVFGASHMVHWCELGLGLLQQLADLVYGGKLGDLLAWCDTNVSMTDHFIHTMDSELLCSIAMFVGDQRRGERLASLLAWMMLYDIIQALVEVVPSEGFQTLDGILCVAALDERIHSNC